jgi:hypothetical protein
VFHYSSLLAALGGERQVWEVYAILKKKPVPAMALIQLRV